MAPHEIAPHETVQKTPELLVLETVAVNCCWLDVFTCTLAGLTLTETDGDKLTVAVPELPAGNTEVAVTVTVAALEIVDGAR